MPGTGLQWQDIAERSVFWGLTDDRVVRYPWAGDSPGGQYLNAHLTYAALFGRPLLFLEGYLLHDEFARRALFDEESILRQLMACGFITILSRNGGNISDMPAAYASQVPIYKSLTQHPQWEPDWHPSLKALEGSSTFRWTPFPEVNYSSGFLKLAKRLVGRSVSELRLPSVPQLGFDRFLDSVFLHASRRPKDGPRSIWEEQGSLFSRSAQRELMGLANELYHMNFGACLTHALGRPIQVATRQSTIFEHLVDEREVMPGSDPSDRDVTAQKIATLALPVPRVRLPRNWIPDGVWVRRIHDELAPRKQAYLSIFDRYMRITTESAWISDPSWRQRLNGAIQDLREAARDYEAGLASMLPWRFRLTSERGGRWMTAGTVLFGLGGALLGAANPLVGAGLGVACAICGVPALLEQRRMRGVQLFSVPGSAAGSLSTILSQGIGVANRQLGTIAAQAHAHDLELYRPEIP